MVSSSTVVGVVEAVAVQLAELAHPVADGLGVHEQLGGDVLAAAVVEQPGAEGVGELLGHGGAQVGHRRQRPRPQVGERLGVGGEHQPGQVVLGVAGEAVGVRPQRPVVRRPHLQPRTRRAGDAPARGEGGEQSRPPATVSVGDEQQRGVVGHVGPVDGLEDHPGQRAADRPAPAPPARSPRSACSAASTRPGRPPPGRARPVTRRAGRRPAVRAAARAPGRSWPARRCARPRSRPTARRCRRTPAPRSPRAGRPGCRQRRRAPTSRATPPGPRCGRRTAARRWSARCAPRHGRAGRRPPWPARSACRGRRRAGRRPAKESRPAPAARRCR